MWGRNYWPGAYWGATYWPVGSPVVAPPPPPAGQPPGYESVTKRKRKRHRAEPEPIQRGRIKDPFLQLGKDIPVELPAPEAPEPVVAAAPGAAVPAERVEVPVVPFPRRARPGAPSVAAVGAAAFLAAHPPVDLAVDDDEDMELITALVRAYW